MAKSKARDSDFLGLAAVGAAVSELGNLTQASNNQALKQQVSNLESHLSGLGKAYRHVRDEFLALKAVSEQLRTQVEALRAENNRLLEKIAKTSPKP